MNLIENRLQLCRRRCEERRQYLAELRCLAERLRADASRLQNEIERAVAAGNSLSSPPLTDRYDKVTRSLASIEGQIGAAGAALTAAERELQHYERVFAARAKPVRLAGWRTARRQKRHYPSPSPAGNSG